MLLQLDDTALHHGHVLLEHVILKNVSSDSLYLSDMNAAKEQERAAKVYKLRAQGVGCIDVPVKRPVAAATRERAWY
eukprot:7117616-Prymnesium_polylepis.1